MTESKKSRGQRITDGDLITVDARLLELDCTVDIGRDLCEAINSRDFGHMPLGTAAIHFGEIMFAYQHHAYHHIALINMEWFADEMVAEHDLNFRAFELTFEFPFRGGMLSIHAYKYRDIDSGEHCLEFNLKKWCKQGDTYD